MNIEQRIADPLKQNCPKFYRFELNIGLNQNKILLPVGYHGLLRYIICDNSQSKIIIYKSTKNEPLINEKIETSLLASKNDGNKLNFITLDIFLFHKDVFSFIAEVDKKSNIVFMIDLVHETKLQESR